MFLPIPASTSENETRLKSTTSLCPECQRFCPAEVWKKGTNPAKIYLKRTCPDHGVREFCISSDARFYHIAKGDPTNACCGGKCSSAEGEIQGTLGRNAVGKGSAPVEVLATCVALIEIVRSCNLPCPTCYASSPLGVNSQVDAIPIKELQTRIQGIIDRKGKIEILQLSGGEPTLHPNFFEFLDWSLSHPKIDAVLINTNGVLLATSDEFLHGMEKRVATKKIRLYLQYDGPQEQGQKFLRGADLRKTRIKTIERCADIGLAIHLAMTVFDENLPYLWDAICFGLDHKHIRGISFQPMFYHGRIPTSISGEIKIQNPVNTADVILALVEKSKGKLRYEDFTPLPCGDPNCASIGFLLRIGEDIRSISDFVKLSEMQNFLHDKVNYRLEDLARCGCENDPLAEVLKKFGLDASIGFMLFIKPFMDARSWDKDRTDRCCTHVVGEDGQLHSFCEYYARAEKL